MNSQTSKYLIALPLLLVFVCIFAFKDEKELLHEVSHEDTLKNIVYQDNLKFLFVPHKNPAGLALSDEESRLLNAGKLARTYFMNNNGKVQEVRCYPMTSTREVEEVCLTTLLSNNPLKKIDQININCSDDLMEMMHRKVIEGDSTEWKTSFSHLETASDDAIVISIIEQCRFPFTQRAVEAAWEVIFHSKVRGVREFYFSDFQDAYNKGLLSCDSYVQLEDKIMGRLRSKSKKSLKFESHDDFLKFLDDKNSAAQNFQDLNTEQYFEKAGSGPIEFSFETN